MSGRRRGLTMVEILVVVALATILIGVAAVVARRMIQRKRIAATRADMRALSVAIEGYFVDNSIYPAWGIGNPGPGAVRTSNWDVTRDTGNRSGVGDLPSFLMADPANPGGRFATLTTPVMYIGIPSTLWPSHEYGKNGYPIDRFCLDSGATYVYWMVYPGEPIPGETREEGLRTTNARGLGWAMVSPGPDGDYDAAGSYVVYDPTIAQPSRDLLCGRYQGGSALTYDPTNGLVSGGDIWRVKM